MFKASGEAIAQLKTITGFKGLSGPLTIANEAAIAMSEKSRLKMKNAFELLPREGDEHDAALVYCEEIERRDSPRQKNFDRYQEMKVKLLRNGERRSKGLAMIRESHPNAIVLAERKRDMDVVDDARSASGSVSRYRVDADGNPLPRSFLIRSASARIR